MKVWLLFALAATLVAQTDAPKQALGRVIGEVTAKEAKQLTVKSDAGPSYSVTTDEKTLFLRVPPGEKDLKKAAKIGPDDVKVGDRVMARGVVAEEQKAVPAVAVIVMTKEDLAEKQKKEQGEWITRGVSGEVKSIGAGGKEVVLSSRARDGVTSLTTVVLASNTTVRRYSPDSLKFSDAKPAAITDMQPGDQARILGQKNADGTRIEAESVVFGTFRTIAGTVISVDAANNELKLKDLETKQPVTIKVNANSQLRKLPPMVANILARRLNPSFQAAAGAQGARGGTGSRPDGAQGGGMGRSDGGGGNGTAAGVRDAGQRSGPGNQGGAPGGSGPGDRPRMGGGTEMMLERAPTFTLAEVTQGEPLIVSTTARAGSPVVNATTVLSGVEPILRSAPAGAGVNLGSWSLEMNIPTQ